MPAEQPGHAARDFRRDRRTVDEAIGNRTRSHARWLEQKVAEANPADWRSTLGPEEVLAVEDVVAERADARQAPARRNAAGVEEQRLAHRRGMQLLVDDLGDRDRILPVLAGARDVGQRAAANEAELAALEDNAAIARREAARSGAVGDDVADRELAGEALALGFEIDGAGEAFELAAAGIAAAELGDGFGKRRCPARSLRPGGSIASASGWEASGSNGCSSQLLDRRLPEARVHIRGDQRLGGRINLGRGDRRSGQGGNHHEGGTKRHEHANRHLGGEPAGWRAAFGSDRRGWFPDCVASQSGLLADMRMPPAWLLQPLISEWFRLVNL